MSSVSEHHVAILLDEIPEWKRKVEEYERLLGDMLQRRIQGAGPTEAAVQHMTDTVDYAKEQVQMKETELERLLGAGGFRNKASLQY